MSRVGGDAAAADGRGADLVAEKGRELVAVAILGLALFFLVATASFHLGDPGGSNSPSLANLCGRSGRVLAGALVLPLGKAAYVLIAFAFHTGVLLLLRRRCERPLQKAIGVVVLCLSVAIALAWMRGADSASQSSPAGVGGFVGAFLAGRMIGAYGGAGTALLLAFLLLVSFLLATDWMLYRALLHAFGGADAGPASPRARRGRRSAESDRGNPAESDADDAEIDDPRARQANATRPAGPARRAGVQAVPPDPAATDLALEPGDDASAAEAEPAQRIAMPPAPPAAGTPAKKPLVIVDGRHEDAGAAKAKDPATQGRAKEPRSRPARDPARSAQPNTGRNEPERATYSFPPVELFKHPRAIHDPASRSMLESAARAIEQRLQAFHIGARVVAATPGPAVTQYELELEEGIQMRRVGAFEPDLAAALKAISVRVVAPIPGKDTVGVEVPNQHREMVVLRELLDLQGVGRAEQAIPILLGKDVGGTPLVEDLARMPHLLIAGTTGSGKSVCISSILLSILMTKTPAQVRLILIDPKMVELQQFKSIPHLLCPVVTNMKKAPGVLEWCVEKMEERYELFVKAGVNHITLFNQLGEKKLKERMGDAFFPGTTPVQIPYVVLIIDELADLMTMAQQEVEGSIQRLAQKSRAVGIHVILATQSPRRDVVTGIIKANLPCKIAFKVSSKLDSRVILDANGAEKLLGHGDLLYVPPGTHRLVRAQGTYVNEEEIRGVVDHLEKNCSPARYAPELLSPSRRAEKRPEEEDELFVEAVKVVLGSQRGSATLLQRALNVGYTRASRLLELMEGDGLVGPFVGSKSREVYITLEAWQAEHDARASAPPSPEGATPPGPAAAPPWEEPRRDDEANSPRKDP